MYDIYLGEVRAIERRPWQILVCCIKEHRHHLFSEINLMPLLHVIRGVCIKRQIDDIAFFDDLDAILSTKQRTYIENLIQKEMNLVSVSWLLMGQVPANK